jgi:hypothetical protein
MAGFLKEIGLKVRKGLYRLRPKHRKLEKNPISGIPHPAAVTLLY